MSMASAGTLYVNRNAAGADNGADWANAFTTITKAIDASAYGDQIWVAQGTYLESLTLKNGVALYGGFSGIENQLNERDTVNHLTMVDADYSAPVVTINNGCDTNTRLDGFIITKGDGIHGGGIRIVASAPVIANNIITGNKTAGLGAGIYCYGFYTHTNEQATIIDNAIVDNLAYDTEGNGGGIACHGASPTIIRNVITRNIASRNGGGISCWAADGDQFVLSASPVIACNYILANAANVLEGASGANVGGGGIHCTATDLSGAPIQGAISTPLIISNVVAANGGWYGGGICVVDSILESAKIINNTIVSNSGSGIFWQNTSPQVSNNIVAFNTWGLEQVENLFTSPVIVHNCIFGNVFKGNSADFKGLDNQTDINGNISVDPRMANYIFGDFHIQPDSPCRNAGDSAQVQSDWLDIDGQQRIQGPFVDIGADESDGSLWPVSRDIIHVKTNGNDALDGKTWHTAKRTITAAIDTAASSYGEIWVAEGIYSETIKLPAFVYLYGGFEGTETDRAQRSIAENETILDANYAGCAVTATNSGYRVSRIDGFTVEKGSPLIQNSTLIQRGGGFWIVSCGPVISNNIIRHNQADDPLWPGFLLDGGGIYAYLAYPLIVDNSFIANKVNNYTVGRGGAVYTSFSGPEIISNIMTQNVARFGPAVYCAGSEPYLSRNLVWQNMGPSFFGAAHGALTFYLCNDFVVSHNIIASNIASKGAGLHAQSCFKGLIQNNLIVNNQAYEQTSQMYGAGGGIYLEVPLDPLDTFYILGNTIVNNVAGSFFEHQGGGIALALLSDNLVIANNIIADNSSGIWQQLGTPGAASLFNNNVSNAGNNYIRVSAGTTDINTDPRFVDSSAWNFRLAPNSSCIDAGHNDYAPINASIDLDGFSRKIDDRCATDTGVGSAPLIDIGAYEFLRSDINRDGKVNLYDLGKLADFWSSTDCGNCAGADLTCDGKVLLDDLFEFAMNWMEGI